MDPKIAPPQNEDSLSGFGYALGAYLIWGIQPIFMKLLSHIPAAEVVAHRVIWSLPLALLVILWSKRTQELRLALSNPKTLLMAGICSVFLTVNWGTYVWSIANGQALQASLGYYINPLFSVVLGRVFLNEQLAPAQWLAIGVAALGVVLLAVDAGELPIVALVLTLTWGIYAYLKKSLPIGPNQGFALEVMILAPFALVYLLWLGADGIGSFALNWRDSLLLMGTGVVTAVPLLLYANGAKRLRLSTIAMMQYLSPTLIFACAIFVFGEPFGKMQAIAFPLIWLALVIFTWSMLRQRKRAQLAA